MGIRGVDISKWNDDLSVATIKKAGFSFAILRGGYTGYGDRSLNKDRLFEDYYAQAKKLGFPVGCYWYSCANSKEFGLKEAKYLYKQCLKNKQFEYPIYIDVEESRWQENNRKGVTDAIIAFCSYLESKGYYCGVYASLDWFNHEIDTARLSKYSKWVARWTNKKPSFKFKNFDIWQNADNGNAGGHKVDTNIAYVDFPKIIKKFRLNGFQNEVVKSIDQLAQEVINGDWGNNEDRKNRLTQAGYDYNKVQERVNQLLKS